MKGGSSAVGAPRGCRGCDVGMRAVDTVLWRLLGSDHSLWKTSGEMRQELHAIDREQGSGHPWQALRLLRPRRRHSRPAKELYCRPWWAKELGDMLRAQRESARILQRYGHMSNAATSRSINVSP